MAINANVLNGFLQVFARKSIPAWMPDMPPRDILTENFDSSIGEEGQSVTTRIDTTVFGNLNNLDNGWEGQQVSSSLIKATLNLLGGDYNFRMSAFATITPQMLLDTFVNKLGKRVANGVTVNLLNNVTSSYFTNVAYVQSSSLFNFTGSAVTSATATGSSGLTGVTSLLDNLGVPQTGRYLLITPNAWQALKTSNNLFNALNYGGTEIIRGNGFKDSNGNVVNSTHPGVQLDGFDVYKYPQLNSSTYLAPYGGDTYSNNDKLVGIAGNKASFVAAARSIPQVELPGWVTYNTTEPTSGWPLQFMMVVDPNQPRVIFGIYSLFGTAAGNPNSLVEIITKST